MVSEISIRQDEACLLSLVVSSEQEETLLSCWQLRTSLCVHWIRPKTLDANV